MQNLKIEFEENKFVISINELECCKVAVLYFIGKLGSDIEEYIAMINKHIKDVEDKLIRININKLKNFDEYEKDCFMIYVDTPFTERFDNLLKNGFSAMVINELIPQENEEFKHIKELLNDYKHIIVQ